MSEISENLTKREFLVTLSLFFKDILNPSLLRSALVTAATHLEIPDAASAVGRLIALDVEVGGEKSHKKQKLTHTADKKDKEKRSLSAYNMMVAWVSDYAAHYGRHPAILQVKEENPGIKMGPSFTSKFFEKFPDKKVRCGGTKRVQSSARH